MRRTSLPCIRVIASTLSLAGLLAGAGCTSSGLVIEPPEPPPDVEVVGGPIRIASVVDARPFSTHGLMAPVHSTSRDPGDSEWTRRVFGRRRTGTTTLGRDRFTRDPAGIPALVRAGLENGVVAAGASVADPDAAMSAPHLDAAIDVFWVRPAFRSLNAKLIYEAVVHVSGDLPGFETPVMLRTRGSMVSGAADGVLWRRAVQRTLERLAAALAKELEERRGGFPAGTAGGEQHQASSP